MSEYHKIQSIYKRDLKTKKLLEGDWSLPEFEYLANNEWEFSEKVDGANIRIIYRDGERGQITFAGRTDEAMIPPKLLKNLNEKFLPMVEKFQFEFGHSLVLYGEGYGAKIQKNGHLYGENQLFVLFDVRVDNYWLRREAVADVAFKLDIGSVPIIGSGTLLEAVEKAKRGINSQWGDFLAEGIVARPKVEMLTRGGDRIIAKIKSRDFDGVQK